MTEEAMMDEEEYGGVYDHIEQDWVDPITIGGRGGARKTHTGVIDALHRALGNIHSYPENGGDICKAEPTVRSEGGNEEPKNP